MNFQKPLNSYKSKTQPRIQPPSGGGYVLKCLEAIDAPSKAGKPMLTLHFDIAEGQYLNYYTNGHALFNYVVWPLIARQTYDTDGAISRLKGIFKAFEDSDVFSSPNEDATTAFDEQKLTGLAVGASLQEYEYMGKDDEIHTALKIAYLCGAQKVRLGEIKTLPIIKLQTLPLMSSMDGEVREELF